MPFTDVALDLAPSVVLPFAANVAFCRETAAMNSEGLALSLIFIEYVVQCVSTSGTAFGMVSPSIMMRGRDMGGNHDNVCYRGVFWGWRGL